MPAAILFIGATAAIAKKTGQRRMTAVHECRAEDAQSAAGLEAYLDKTAGETWREAAGAGTGGAGAGAGAGGPSGGGPRSRDEALEILGLEPGATRDEVREAHRRLMQKVHPDHGGSNYLAAKINQAKELLLGE